MREASAPAKREDAAKLRPWARSVSCRSLFLVPAAFPFSLRARGKVPEGSLFRVPVPRPTLPVQALDVLAHKCPEFQGRSWQEAMVAEQACDPSPCCASIQVEVPEYR